MISYILYRTASFLTGLLPRACCTRIAAAIAFLFFAFRPSIRRNVRMNFDRLGMRPDSVFPVFRNFSRAVADLLRLSHMSREELVAQCAASGIENIDRALAKGKGAILVAPHLGPWELAGAYMSCLGYRIHSAALEHPSARVTRFFSEKRRAWGISDYPSNACGHALMKALGRNEAVVLLIDRNFSKRGIRVRFLGADVLLPDGHIALAMRTGASLLPCCCWYGPEGAVELSVGEEIRAGDADDPRAAIGRACAAGIEEFIRSHPEQWFAFDHLWSSERHV